MAIVYYINPGIATAVQDEPGFAGSTFPMDPPFVSVSQEVYQAELAELLKDNGGFAIKASRSSLRLDPFTLQDHTIDAGRGYAIYVEDDLGLDITQVVWELNGMPVNTEFSAPWDYNGTDVGGGAIKISFIAGVHEIDAHITYGSGSVITLTATFETD